MYGYIYEIYDSKNSGCYIGKHKSKEWDSKYLGSGRITSNIGNKRPEDLKIRPIHFYKSKEELNLAEKMGISFYKDLDYKLYNLTEGGDGFDGNHTEQAKRKISEARLGIKCSEEAKRKQSNSMKGKNKGPQSKERKTKQSERLKGKPHPHIGTIHTNEGKKNQSESMKGKNKSPLSKEHKSKIGDSAKGKHFYNNGFITKRCYECPEGFVPGMLKRSKRK